MDFHLDIKEAVEEKLDTQDKIKPEHSLVLFWNLYALNIWILNKWREFLTITISLYLYYKGRQFTYHKIIKTGQNEKLMLILI